MNAVIVALHYVVPAIGGSERGLMRSIMLKRIYFLDYCLSSVFRLSSVSWLIPLWQLSGMFNSSIFNQFVGIIFWMIN